MTHLRLPLFLCALAALGQSSAQAQDLYLGSRTTQVTRTDFLDGDSTLVGLCGGIVQSMTYLGGDVFIGDQNGNIYLHEPASGAFGYAFTSANDATSLVAEGGDLLVGGSDGSILRYDPSTGTLEASLSIGASFPVSAMILVGNELIVGSISGLIQSGDAVTGGFQFWGTCGNDINAMVSDGDQLFAADVGGTLWRFEVVTQGLVGQFSLPSEGLGLALIGGDVIVGCEDGAVRRLDHFGGALKSSFQAGFVVDALTVVEHPEPGSGYCLGSVCPCGNNDSENGCVNSTGFGSGLIATGSASVVADDFVLAAYDLPPNAFGRYYMGPQQDLIPFGDGMLCLAGGGYPVFRLQLGNTGATGVLYSGPGLIEYVEENLSAAGQIFPGSTWHFQAWYRDPNGACGSNFNTTSAYSVTFLP